jgi:opacity protein-like surface antigen
MRCSRLIALGIFVSSIGWASAASAQDKGATGVTMGYPAAIGIVHHVSDRFAIRPEVTFAVANNSSDTGGFASESDTWTIGVGASAILYLREWDKLRTYVSPRYAYFRGETTTMTAFSFPLEGPTENTTTSRQHNLVGSFGAQFAAHEKFSLYGEIGIGYTRQRSRSELTDGRGTSNQVSTRSGVGVIFYF